MEARLAKLETATPQVPDVRNEIRRLRRELTDLKKKIYSQLKPWETVEVARHPDRPMTTDYLELVFDEFVDCTATSSLATIGPSAPAGRNSIPIE